MAHRQLDLGLHAAAKFRQAASGGAARFDLASRTGLRCLRQAAAPEDAKAGRSGFAYQGAVADFVADGHWIAPDRRVCVLMEIMGGQKRGAVGAEQIRAL